MIKQEEKERPMKGYQDFEEEEQEEEDPPDWREPFRHWADGKQEKGPLVVEIPLKAREKLERPRCEVIRSDGKQCERPAEMGKQCLRHFRWYSMVPAVYAIPFPEDGLTLQETLARTLELVLVRRVTAQEGMVLVELFKLLAKNLKRCEWEMEQYARRNTAYTLRRRLIAQSNAEGSLEGARKDRPDLF